VTELIDRRKQLLWVGLAGATMVPGVVVRVAGLEPPHVATALIFGMAIVGAAFVLSWGAEVVQLDISAGLALALLALIAVLPEYAVDFVFTHKAGVEYAANPAGPFQWAPLALANMTGGNQLLIGAGWPLVVLLGTWRIRRALGPNGKTSVGSTGTEVVLEPAQTVDIAYLTLATLYGLTLPLRHTLTIFDAFVLVGIYIFYLRRLAQAPAEEPHLVGPPAMIALLPARRRRMLNVGMFITSAAVILICAEPFAESLVAVGEQFGISTFLLVKWLAPLASEAPELLVAGLFAWRLAPYVGLGALVSSKVNQWTLLVGTLPIVFALAAGGLHGLPLDALQRDELFVTAAQSVFAVAVLASRSMSRKEAWVMLALFVAQLLSSGIIPSQDTSIGRVSVGVVFLLCALWVLRRDIGGMRSVLRDGFTAPYAEM
jgi:cation:H+ antiporter